MSRLNFSRELLLLAVFAPLAGAEKPVVTFVARAYSLPGITADGSRTARGIVAADPRVLPMGSRILISEAGPYSGEYTVHDKGGSIVGRQLDVYMPSRSEALRFGRKVVKVEVLSLGKRRSAPARTTKAVSGSAAGEARPPQPNRDQSARK